MPTDTPDLVSEYEDQKQSAPDLVSEFEQQKTAQDRPDFTQEALSGKLAPVTGKPKEPQGEERINGATGLPYRESAVPEAEGWRDPLIHIAAGAEPVATGLSRIKENSAPPVSPQMPMGRSSRGGPAVLPQAPHTPEQVQRDRQTMLGGAEVMEGASQLGTVALPASLASAPIKVGAGLVAGTIASEGAGKAVHGKVSPEAERAIRALSFIAPSAAGMMAGLKFSGAETPDGEAKFSGVEAFGGKAKAGYVRTPESIRAGAKIGDTQFEVNIPRNGQPAPAAPAPAPTLTPGEQAMVEYGQRTGEIPKAPPPAPPPTPSQKAGMDNKLSSDQVDFVAQAISKAPPEQQNALIEEAHKNISQWINDNNGKVFIGGKIHIAKNPDQVESLAAKIINDASSAHDKAQDLAAKEQEKAQKEQEKQSTAKTAQPSAPAPAPKPAAAPAKVDVQPKAEAPKGQPVAEKPVVQKVEEKPVHDFASTQVNIEPKSELGQQHAQAVAAMPEEHIGPNDKEDTPHVTVRYGLKDDSPEAIAKIKEAASKVAPFEATVGKTTSFPATKEGDRPIIAQVEKSPELNALRSVVEGAGNFKEDTHGEYKPHVTLGYVKPEHVSKYEGGNHLEGGKVPVDHVAVTKRDGTSETIKLGGQPVPDLVAQHEATPDLVVEHEGANQRKPENADLRARFDKMSPEERSKALVEYHERERTSDTVDLPNKLAFTEAEHAGKSPAVAMSDADGLKALNDKFGYDAGNALLKAKAEALKEAGLDSYHDKGDEFLHRGESAEDLKTKLSKARDILKSRVISVEKSDGTVLKFKGADFSYGTGKDLDTAEAGLKAHKSQREAAGERKRGELRGITEAGPQAGKENHGGPAEVKLPEGIPAKGQAARAKIKASIKGKPSERGFAAADIPEVLARGVVEPVTSFVKDTIAKTAEARSVDDKLFGLGKQYEADVLRAIELMKQVGPLSTPEDQAAIYHHLEDSSVPLDPKQQSVLDKIVKPLMSQSSAIRSELNDAGVPMGEEGYVHRVVQGKSSQLERAMQRKQGTGKGNVLSKAASSTKGRVMMGLTAEGSGRRVVVSIKGDRVTKFEHGKATDLGPLRSGMTSKFELQDEKLAPLADKIIELKQKIKDLPEKDRAEQISAINEKISDLEAQRETLNTVKGRVRGQRAAYGVEPTFNQRKAITQQMEKLVTERDRIQNTKDDSFLSNAGKEAIRRAQEHLTVAEGQRARLLEQVDPSELEDKIWVDANGKKWTINQGTTKEIEKHTDLKYYHNALASAVTDYLQLLRAKRANDALESMKSDPGFNQMAFKSEKGSMPPDGWQSVNLPQFRDYYFEPHMAEVLNRFAKELHPDPVTFLEKVGNFMTASLLLNPVRHIYNIGNHWLVERGVTGTFNPLTWPTAARAGMKAIKAVVNQNEDFLSALDHGAPMMSHRTDLQALHHELFQTIVGHLEKNPGIADQIAKFTGWDKADAEDTGVVNTVARGTGLRMLNNIRKLGQKAMWMSNDMMMLQSAYEKMANSPGMSFEDAMKQTERHIPNYRIPTRIMNSKGIADFMGSRLASMFGRYHYGVWRSYGEMAKEALGPNSTPKERLNGLNHMIMLGLITFVLYKLTDAVLKKITGNPDARMVRSGASAAPNSIKEIIQGHEDPSQLLRNTFTPAILPQATAEAMFNRDFFSGAPVRNPKHSAGKQVIDVSKHFMNALGPVQQYNQATRNPHPARSFALSQVGISTNHPKKHR